MPLIAIDWGSSNCRAYLVQDGQIIARQETEKGIKSLERSEFSDVFEGLAKPWLQHTNRAFLFGMVTSRDGWVETPYLTCPAGVEQIEAASVVRRHGDFTIHFLPGLSQVTPACDVMRGEEMQLFGLAQTAKAQLVLLPGTHSKWAILENGKVKAFRTIITGEVFDLLLKHSLVGRLSTSDQLDLPTFRTAVHRGFENTTLVADLFSARASVLLGDHGSDQVHSYLSGLLIGAELREGFSIAMGETNELVIVGNRKLVETYRIACDTLGIGSRQVSGEASIATLQRLSDGMRAPM